ncbi:hypothetical protein D3C83_322500 [compost metagenome]
MVNRSAQHAGIDEIFIRRRSHAIAAARSTPPSAGTSCVPVIPIVPIKTAAGAVKKIE